MQCRCSLAGNMEGTMGKGQVPYPLPCLHCVFVQQTQAVAEHRADLPPFFPSLPPECGHVGHLEAKHPRLNGKELMGRETADACIDFDL